MKIKLIGTGGIGLCVLPVLARFVNFNTAFEDPQIHLIDGDAYEEKNRDRQQFNDFGNKAEVTAKDYSQQFPRIFWQAHPTYLDEVNAVRFIRNGDLVMLCVDNHNTRKIVDARAKALQNITIINGGNDTTDGNVIIHLKRDGVDLTPPMVSHYHQDIAQSDDLHPSQMNQPGSCTRMAAQTPQLVIMNNLIAANMLAAFYNLTNPQVYSDIVQKNLVNYGEIYSDLITMRTVPQQRFVQKS